jgi:hypothetical protein
MPCQPIKLTQVRIRSSAWNKFEYLLVAKLRAQPLAMLEADGSSKMRHMARTTSVRSPSAIARHSWGRILSPFAGHVSE